MSLATVEPRPFRSAHHSAPSASDTASAPRLRAVPDGSEARGFVLYVGLSEAEAAAAGTDLATVVAALRRLTEELVPTSETHAAVALAPRGSGGRDVDVVRLALHDPSALAAQRAAAAAAPIQQTDEDLADRVVIDLSRKRVLLDGVSAALTYKEFELLQFLVLREGRTVSRADLIQALWNAADEDAPNERTIDVHVRRLRAKLGFYQDIVRTVRGTGYRFDRHADVVLRYPNRGPSPDRF